MRYRQRRFFPDDALAATIARLLDEVGDGDLELVLNGDIFDFDVPRPDGRAERVRREAEAAACVERILDAHPGFVEALARVLVRGHRVVFVSGNHDVQLVFPEVRERIVVRLERAAAALSPRRVAGAALAEVSRAVRVRVLFRAWFHRTVDGVHVEHGSQYDPYCVVRFPQAPYVPDSREIQPTMSSLTMRHLVGRMGYFNPNVDSSFLLSFPQYLAHWGRYYLFSRRSLVAAWALGSLRVAGSLLAGRVDDGAERALANLLRTARETGASLEALSEHGGLAARPDVGRTVRLLWLDRLAVAAVALVGLALLAARPVLGGALLACAAAIALASRRLLPAGDLAPVYARLPSVQGAIARLHGASAVVFGHTHIATGAWRDGVFHGNCGTWAPMYEDIECTRAVGASRHLVWLRADDAGALEGGLYRATEEGIVPEPDATRRCESRARGVLWREATAA